MGATVGRDRPVSHQDILTGGSRKLQTQATTVASLPTGVPPPRVPLGHPEELQIRVPGVSPECHPAMLIGGLGPPESPQAGLAPPQPERSSSLSGSPAQVTTTLWRKLERLAP